MKLSDTIRGLLRRWYIVLPGLLLAASLSIGTWFAIPPGYNRSATQLLIPGENSVPEGGNPYLFLGGLAPAADVLVRAIGSENVMNEVVDQYPGIEVEIARDTTTGGPIILVDVTASSDAAAENVLTMLLGRSAAVLNEFQELEGIPEANRMTVIPVTVDERSTEETRSRLLAAVGVGALGVVLSLVVAGLVDGASLRRRERHAQRSGEPGEPDASTGRPDIGDAIEAAPSPEHDLTHPDQSPVELWDDERVPTAPRSRITR